MVIQFDDIFTICRDFKGLTWNSFPRPGASQHYGVFPNSKVVVKSFPRLSIFLATVSCLLKKMDLETEEAFKICGLCTQYVDESVVIKAELKSFLLEFLALDERKKNSPSLPEKTCLECYQSALECKRFRDACHKSISKLQKNNKIASDMILGKSGKVSSSGKKIAPSKKVSSEAMNSLKADAGASKKKKILESLGLDPDQIDIDVSTTPAGGGMTGRRSRSSAAKEISSKHTGTRGRQNSNNFVYKECHVYIKKVERDRADRAFGSSVMVDAPVSRPGKRKLTSQNTPASAPPSAKRPKGRPPKAANLTPNTVNAGRPRRGVTPAPSAPEDKEDTKLSRSSFGRVRNSATKSGYVYGKDLNISPDIEVTATPPPSKSKTPRKTVQGKQQESPIPFTSEVEEEDEDMEEVFPTIGPYQCEICQVITDTKAEFVAHIKGKHHDVVDEEVLNSLESDLRKSKKKQEKELSIANGTPAPQVKKTPAKK